MIDSRELRFHLPDGYHWSLDRLNNAEVETRFGSYHRKVHQKDGTLVIEEDITLPPQIIQTKDYGEFREFCLAVDEIQRLELKAEK